jgi:hypothetical protein
MESRHDGHPASTTLSSTSSTPPLDPSQRFGYEDEETGAEALHKGSPIESEGSIG